MVSDSDLARALRDRLGDDAVVDRETELAPYRTELRGRYRSRSAIAVLPRDTESVAAAVTLCAAHGVGIVPQGGNTGLCGGAVADRGQVIVNLRRMNRVLAVDPPNDSMTVQAGCILADLQQAAASAGRLFPLSLGAEGSCQIGGNLATNAGGTNVLRYGNARDQVLGLEVVLPDGRVWDGLSGLRKDNTGYDLKHLFIGSEGTLGIITAATVKLYPRPDHEVTAMAALADVDAAVALLGACRKASDDRMTSFELMPRFGLEIAVRHVEGCRDPFAAPHPWYVLVTFGGGDREALAEAMEGALGDAIAGGRAEDAVIAQNEAQAADFWRLREGLVEAQKAEGASIKHDVSVTVSRVPELLRRAAAFAGERIPGVRVCAFGHLGDGNIHFNLSQPVGADPAEYLRRWQEITEGVHDLVAELGGSFSAEHGVGLLRLPDMARYKDPVALDLMRRIKRAVDPAGIMNPGKVIDTARPAG